MTLRLIAAVVLGVLVLAACSQPAAPKRRPGERRQATGRRDAQPRQRNTQREDREAVA